MLYSFKNSFGFLILSLTLFVPSLGFCDIWDQAIEALAKHKSNPSYTDVRRDLPLLTPVENIVFTAEQPDTFVLAGGYVVITPRWIRTFKNPVDVKDPNFLKIQPEFEFTFVQSSAPKETSLVPSASPQAIPAKKDLKGIRIAVDIIPTHDIFKGLQIGKMSYEEFVSELQTSLMNALADAGADVFKLRPRMKVVKDDIDKENLIPPHIVISPEFNNDKQDCMTTFCGGGIRADEFANERVRARFVVAALTGKALHSAELGACVTSQCKKNLKVEALAWQNAFFKSDDGSANAFPVQVSDQNPSFAKLDRNNGKFNGIAMRNQWLNGIFAQAVVAPFPDMQWVQKQVQVGKEIEWINQYSRTLTEAILEYVEMHSDLFSGN